MFVPNKTWGNITFFSTINKHFIEKYAKKKKKHFSATLTG